MRLDLGAYSRVEHGGLSTRSLTHALLLARRLQARRARQRHLRHPRDGALRHAWTFAWNWQQLSALDVRIGGAPLPPFDTFPLLVACLLGSLVLVWSVLRLAAPDVRLGRYDGVARFLFSTWMAWALHATGAPLLWLFLVPELAWGVVQWWPVRRAG